jgi:hypothetical protein
VANRLRAINDKHFKLFLENLPVNCEIKQEGTISRHVSQSPAKANGFSSGKVIKNGRFCLFFTFPFVNAISKNQARFLNSSRKLVLEATVSTRALIIL